MAREAATVTRAANALLEHARAAYMDHRSAKHMGDDTTVLCVDLNPSALPFVEASAGCCVAQ